MDIKTYENFDLLIEKIGDGCRSKVIRSPAGDDAECNFELAAVQNDLRALTWLPERLARHFKLVQPAGGQADRKPAAQQVGESLYAALFGDKVGECLRISLHTVREKKMGLRIRLRFGENSAELAQLPWELVYPPELSRHLATSVETVLVRYMELPRPADVWRVKRPLRLLVVTTDPQDAPRLAVEKELELVEEAVKPLRDRGALVTEALPHATWKSLGDRLRADDIHILHFIGHGYFDDDAGVGGLVFEKPDRSIDEVNASTLATLLHDRQALRLVFLNACKGATGDRDNAFAGTAQKLVQQGVPAVAAMQFPIGDEAAVELGRTFYAALADGHGVDAALGEARKAIAREGMEWATPALFLRVADGDIFGLDEDEQEREEGVRRVALERPERARFFTGRGDQLQTVCERLQPGAVVIICGPGGMGKSALAAEAVWALAPRDEPPAQFADGVLTYTFYRRPAMVNAYEQIARAFGETEMKPSAYDAAQRALAGRKVLLVLDGAEAAENLAELLEIRDRCGVLVTTRAHSGACTVDLEPLQRDEAVGLLREWAGPRGLSAAGSDEQAGRICELVGDLPLAVQLAGSYLAGSGLHADEYLEWLEESPLGALDHGVRRLESVPVLLAKSTGQVSEAARGLLGVAGVLALVPFGRELAAAALALKPVDALKPLGELVKMSLLARPDEQYTVSHALVHTYARTELAAPVETVERAGAYLAGYVEAHQEDSEALQGVWRHVLALIEAAAKRQAWRTVDKLGWAIDGFLDRQGYTAERRYVCEWGVAAARGLADRQSEGAWLCHLGIPYLLLGQAEKAIECCEQALAIAREIGDRQAEGAGLGNLGLAVADLGQVERAIGYYEQALVIRLEINDRHGEGDDLGSLGNAYLRLAQAEKAIGYYERALAVAREIGDRQGEGNHLGNLGNAYLRLGQVERAIECHEQALAIACEIEDRRGEGNRLGNLGSAYLRLGQMERAIGYFEQALAIHREIKYRQGEGNALGSLGLAYFSLGQAEQAIGYYERALAIHREIKYRQGEGNHLGGLGRAVADLGQVERAIQYHEQALAISREIKDRRGEGNALGNLGSAYLRLGQVEQAIGYYKQALAIHREIKYRQGEGSHLENLGITYAQLGDLDEARAYWAAALGIFEEIRSPHAETVRRRLEKV